MIRPSARPSLSNLGRIALAALGTVAALTLFSAATVLAADDTTPPVGTVVVGDGSGYVNRSIVTLHVPATDDVGVTEVQVHSGLMAMQTFPYAPTISWTIDSAYEGSTYVNVIWVDAAGNQSQEVLANFILDRTAPKLEVFDFAFDADYSDLNGRRVRLHALDASSPLSVRFSSDNGVSWGAWRPYAPEMEWASLDPAAGGSRRLGRRTVLAQVRDPAGNVSTPASKTALFAIRSVIQTSPAKPTTGQTVTLIPMPSWIVLPPNAECQWEITWGNDRSIYYGERDESYGGIYISGPAAKGFCSPWMLTLPWAPVPQYVIRFTAEAGGTLVEGRAGSHGPDDPTKITAAVGSTSRHIKTSSLPLVYLLPEDDVLIVGERTTYRAYPVAGATIAASDSWTADLGNEEAAQQRGGSSFTFVPRRPAHVVVSWNASRGGYAQSAYFDPPARYRDTSRPNTTAPVQRIGGAAPGLTSGVPTRISWSGTDRGWGIAKYHLQRSVDGGRWRTVVLPGPRSTSIVHHLAPGHSYRYRVRAIDKAGHWSSWDLGATFRPRVYNETNKSIVYRRTWTRGADARDLGGHAVATSRSGAMATFTFTGRDVAWIAERRPTNGKARVYVDGRLAATIDLRASGEWHRRVVWSRHWSTVGTHTIRVVNLATATRPTIGLDAFLVLR